MSRMDILTKDELSQLLADSQLTKKYNEKIDRESAYEMLSAKIEKAEAEEAKEKARQEKEALKEAASKRRSTSSRRSNKQNPIIKVLSSPTVIRSVLGILTKMLK